MKKLMYFLMAALMMVGTVSCKKDAPLKIKYGVDGKTPLPEAVDIGLVVNGKNIKWASFNLGAGAIHEYGDYYAWGETEPHYESLDPLVWRKDKDDKELHYDWASYSLANGSSMKLNAYCPGDKTNYWDWDVAGKYPDGETVLLPTDDIAHVRLGGKWRIPTADEFNALLALKDDNDHYEWDKWALLLDENGDEIRNAHGSAIHGLRITQRSTGHSIFFPAAGFGADASIDRDRGRYWSSSLHTETPNCANYLYFNKNESALYQVSRYFGHSIRPVCEE